MTILRPLLYFPLSVVSFFNRPKVNRRVRFEKSPAPRASPLGESRNITKQEPAEAVANDQSKQVLHEMQNPAATGTALPQSPIIEEPIDNRDAEETSLAGQALERNAPSNTLDIEERHSSENPRVYSETSSLSESGYVDAFEDKAKVSGFVSLLG